MVIRERVFESQGVYGDLPLEGCIFSLGVILMPFPLCTWGREAEAAVKETTIKSKALKTRITPKKHGQQLH